MNSQSPQGPSEEAARFKEAIRRILSLTPEQREAVKRKVAEEAERQNRDGGKNTSEETPGR